MSTPPPGRPPYPPQQPPQQPPYPGQPYVGDPRSYWRFQRAQQRNAWRIQQQMLRAQRRALRRPSVVGPVLLIAIGVLALLLVTGRIAADSFWAWYGHWWPTLLIVLGLVALVEWFLDARRAATVQRSFGGYVGLVVFLLILGAIAGGWEHFHGPWQSQFGDDSDDFFSAFSGPQHTHDMEPVTASIPSSVTTRIQIQNPRGDVQVAASDGNQIAVISHATVYGGSDDEAQKIFVAHRPRVTVAGNSAVIAVAGADNLRSNLTVTVPRSASVTIVTTHGDAAVTGLSGDVDATLSHGDFQADSIGGHVHAHLASRGGSISAHQIGGDVTAEGVGDDVTFSDIRGQVQLNGDYTGDIHLERVEKSIHFHSSRTDFSIADGLPGDLSMDLDSLHATQILGKIHLVTRSKDIELSQIFGPAEITDSDGRVELDLAGSYPVQIKNSKGDIEIAVPPGAGFQVSGQTHNGDIVSDFPLTITGDQNKTVSGQIGKGGPEISLITDNADLHIRKGDTAPPRPAAPDAPGAPAMPRLRLPHGQAADSVTQ
jgi:hypothetical protein